MDWDDAYEDILRKLKEEFKRDVIFDYELHGRVMRVHDDEGFDRAMAVAERGGNVLYAVVQQAVWSTKPVRFRANNFHRCLKWHLPMAFHGTKLPADDAPLESTGRRDRA